MRRCVDCFARWKFVFSVSVRRRTIVLCASMLSAKKRKRREVEGAAVSIVWCARQSLCLSIRVLQLVSARRGHWLGDVSIVWFAKHVFCFWF